MNPIMKRTNCVLCLLMFILVKLSSQTGFEGTYHGQVNGDPVKLILNVVNTNHYQGTMEDSQQKFMIDAELKESKLSGIATESSMGLNFQFNARLDNHQLTVSLFSEEIGMKEALVFMLERAQLQTTPGTTSTSSTIEKVSNFKFPKEAQRHENLVGIWRKEEQYNSGFGDNYMGASSSQKLILFANGAVADGGSQTTISGSNYLGQHTGEFQALPNVYWYNISNQLYLVSIDDGKTNTVHLGKYFIENGAMLITNSNGAKSLFYKE